MKWLIALIAAIILGLLGYCGIKCVAQAGQQTPQSVSVLGLRNMNEGQPHTLTVQVQYPAAFTSAVTVKADIYEDDNLGNDYLVGDVAIQIPAGSRVGTGTFVLTCESNTRILKGDTSDYSDPEDPWHVFATLKEDNNTDSAESLNHELHCRPGDQGEDDGTGGEDQ